MADPRLGLRSFLVCCSQRAEHVIVNLLLPPRKTCLFKDEFCFKDWLLDHPKRAL